MVLLDKHGYYYSHNHWMKVQLITQVIDFQKSKGKQVSKEDIDTLVNNIGIDAIHNWVKKIRPNMDHDIYTDTFFDFAMNNLKNKNGDQEDKGISSGKFMVDNDINGMLMAFHSFRFIKSGSITYKIREAKALQIMNYSLSIPAHLLVLPFKEFMISVPVGCIRTNFGSLVNIYVSEEVFRPEIYLNSNYEVDQNIKNLIAKHGDKIRRIVRCYGICMPDNVNENAEAKTSYYQFPIIEDEDIQQQFLDLVATANPMFKDSVIKMFNLMLNFCAWLSINDPDIERKLGVIRKPVGHNPKKIKVAERENMISSYDYYDVGRIYDTRYCTEVEFSTDSTGRRIIKRFKVRAHLRAQWYGSRENSLPGTHQKIILIKEHEKGDDLSELKPKIMEAR